MTIFTHLECGLCEQRYEPDARRGRCACGGPLLARYDLDAARANWSRDWVRNGPVSLWRYAPVLPVRQADSIVSLGEGMTPLLLVSRLGREMGVPRLWVKQEGANPAGSWKARRMACAVSMARELRLDKVAVASPGNAAVALSLYAAAAGLTAKVLMCPSAPPVVRTQCQIHGAELTQTVPEPGETDQTGPWRNVGPWREPYGLEGAKTLGYELAEQFNWEAPDAIVCPCGSGQGLVALWKACAELKELSWIAGPGPKLIAVSLAEGATPDGGFGTLPAALLPELALRGPQEADLVGRALRETGGAAIPVQAQDLVATGLRMAAQEGILLSLEGAACVSAVARALEQGILRSEQRIVVVNPGAGWNHLDLYARRLRSTEAGQAARQGGLITPR